MPYWDNEYVRENPVMVGVFLLTHENESTGERVDCYYSAESQKIYLVEGNAEYACFGDHVEYLWPLMTLSRGLNDAETCWVRALRYAVNEGLVEVPDLKPEIPEERRIGAVREEQDGGEPRDTVRAGQPPRAARPRRTTRELREYLATITIGQPDIRIWNEPVIAPTPTINEEDSST